MSDAAKRMSGFAVAVVLGVVAALSIAFVQGRSHETAVQAREIVLEARDAVFAGGNPTLAVRRGERVRLVVRNTDPGVVHSIVLPGLYDRRVDLAYGDEAVIEFTATRAGTFEYICPQHLPRMRGKLVVEP